MLWSRSHFGPAPAQASQDGGSSSSSSPQFVAEKKFSKISLLNLPGLFYLQKCTSALLCSSSTLLKGQINLIYIIVNFFVLSFFKHGVIAGACAVELEPEPPLFSRLRLWPKRAAPGGSGSGSTTLGPVI